MATRMLIDARHPEETRVAVLKGNRIEEFDFESAEHKQIKGNIYLAKVTRVEPSLQAAFVDFGGNRHGFLAFGEIHPDYYQIPREDRERLETRGDGLRGRKAGQLAATGLVRSEWGTGEGGCLRWQADGRQSLGDMVPAMPARNAGFARCSASEPGYYFCVCQSGRVRRNDPVLSCS